MARQASFLFCVLLLAAVLAEEGSDVSDGLAADQLVTFLKNHPQPIGNLTTSYGVPVDYSTAHVSLNTDLIYNRYFLESMSHLTREKIPERPVHGVGGGAFGYFEVTDDLTSVLKPKMFEKVGKKTPIAARFSGFGTERGGADLNKEPHGFAVKFYTEEGNFDIPGNSFDIFIFKDPLHFPAYVHSTSKNPQTHKLDVTARWDFLLAHPESFHISLLAFGDRGDPDGYRHMSGHGIHSYQCDNAKGEVNFVKFHMIPDAGDKWIIGDDVANIPARNPWYAGEDLYNAIANKTYPSWTFGIQVIPEADVEKAGFDIFDVSLRWPYDKYPVKPVGKLVLNRNPKNWFAEMEQLAFCPGNLVPGIQGVDTMFQARSLFYRDSANFRIGSNHNRIEVNRPHSAEFDYLRDGAGPVAENGLNAPNYYPNRFDGPEPLNYTMSQRHKPKTVAKPTHYEQANELYKSFSKDEISRLVNTIASSMSRANKIVHKDVIAQYTKINKELGSSIAAALKKIIG